MGVTITYTKVMALVKNHLHWSDRKIGNPTGFAIRGQKPLLVQVQLTTPLNTIDESSKGRTSAKPHGESGFESQLVDLLYYAEEDQ